MRSVVGKIYQLNEEETANLSDKDVYRAWHDYWTNKYSVGGLFTDGNRQEVSAAVQADMIGALTGEETNRMGLIGDSAKQYVDKYALNPDNSILQYVNEDIAEQIQQQEQVQEAVEQNQSTGQNGIEAKGTEGTFNNNTTSYTEQGTQENNQQQTQNKNTLPDKLGDEWEYVDDGSDPTNNRLYKNRTTGRLAHVQLSKDQKGRVWTVRDVTNEKDNTVGVGAWKGIGRFNSIDKVAKYLNLPRANKSDTAFMADSQTGNEQAGVKQALPKEDGVIADKDIVVDENKNQWLDGRLIQSNKAVEVHTLKDLNDYFDEHGDLMSPDLYAEIARNMMRFGIGESNNTSIVLDLSNQWAGGKGSKTTWMENPNDPNSAIAKAVVRLYAGADLVTAAHEVAHLGWINLSQQDRDTFTKWAKITEEDFVARVLGRERDENFSSYLKEALTNRGVGGSATAQALWKQIR